MAFLNVQNNAESTLSAGIDNAVTELVVAAGEGALFPSTNFHISIDDEILLCTSRTTDTFTVTRAQESTGAASHSTDATIELRVTAQIITEIHDAFPSSATAHAIVRFDGTTGEILKNSVVTIADTTGNMAGVGTFNTHTIPGGTGTLALTSDLASYLALAGGTMAGAIAMGTNKITGLGDPTLAQDAVTKNYVDLAVGFQFDYFFNDTSAGIGATGYLNMTDTDLGGGESDIETVIGSSGDDKPLDAMFISLSGEPGVEQIEAGVYEFHFHAAKTAGSSAVDGIYIKLYQYKTDTTENLLGTTEISGAITSVAGFDIHMVLTDSVELATTDRLLVKFYANLSGGAGATVNIYAEGASDSHFSFNVSSAILSSLFIRQDGTTPLTANWNVGAFNMGIGITPLSVLHIKASIPGTIGSHPAGQLIIQSPTDSVFSNVVITGYESDGDGNPDQQLWYLGSSSVSNSNITFLNRRNSSLTLGTNNTTRLTISASGNVDFGTNDITGVGSLGVTGTRITKGWFTDLEVTNAIAGSITGNAATVSTITTLAPDTATTQATQASITTCANLVSIGTIATGVWQGTDVGPEHGGTGVSNGANNTITFTGNFTLGLILSANTALTLPTTGTLVNTAVTALSSLATVGTITSGTLSTGAVLADVTMTLGSDADGDIYYRSSNKLTRLAKGTATQVLTMNAGATAPEWAAAAGGDLWTLYATATKSDESGDHTFSSMPVHDYWKIVFDFQPVTASGQTMEMTFNNIATGYVYQQFSGTTWTEQSAANFMRITDLSANYTYRFDYIITGKHKDGDKNVWMANGGVELSNRGMMGQLTNDSNDLTRIDIAEASDHITGTYKIYYLDGVLP